MGRVAILGASGTIGSAVARRLASGGCQVLLLGRNPEKLEPLARELSQPWAVFDPRESSSLEVALTQLIAEHGAIQGLVNCIGSVLLKPAHITCDAEFREIVETNLFTAFATVRAAGKLMRETGGSVVLFASAAAEIGIQNHEAIAAAKAGVIGLARSAASTYAPLNIRVNVVSPGLIRTEMTRRIWDNPLAAVASKEMHALGRFGEADQVASLVDWLLDPQNDFMTGQVLGVDGGLGHLVPARRPARPAT